MQNGALMWEFMHDWANNSVGNKWNINKKEPYIKEHLKSLYKCKNIKYMYKYTSTNTDFIH